MSEAKPEAKPILEAKDKLSNILPIPPGQQKPVSSAQALKERLDWGEPACTIADARDRNSFNTERILGALPIDSEETLQRLIDSLSPRREVYIYGDNEEQVQTAVDKFVSAGFESVSRLQGGLAGWKAVSGPTEGRN